MALTVINLSDPISTWVSKSNTISTNLGDLATLTDSSASLVIAINKLDSDIGNLASLTTSSDIDLVSAINALQTDKYNTTDSAAIKDYFIGTTGAGGISYDSGSGGLQASFTLIDSAVTTAKLDVSAVTEPKIATNSIVNRHLTDNIITNTELADSSVGFSNIQSSVIKSNHFASSTSIIIKNTAGTTLKTIFGPGV